MSLVAITKQNKLAFFKKGIQYVGWQNVEELGMFIINKTVVITFSLFFICNSISSKYIFIARTAI